MTSACSGLIKCFNVFHQLFCLVFGLAKFSVNLFNTSFFDLRISLVTRFLNCLYVSKWLILLYFLYLSYSLFFFLMTFLTCVVNQAGSVLRVFINLLGACLFARVVILSVVFPRKCWCLRFLKFASQFELDHLKMLGSYPYHIWIPCVCIKVLTVYETLKHRIQGNGTWCFAQEMVRQHRLII